jgi:2-polyprenyl-3-methyl-5-hydroxy-6-metoxy-1,4-benzoquinol methylase
MTAPAFRRLDLAWQRVAARATRLVPPPLGLTRLAAPRACVVDAVFERRRADVERAQQQYLDGRGTAALEEVASSLLDEARVEMRRAHGSWWARIATELDAALPNGALEHMDDPAFDERERTSAIRDLDLWNRRAGSYAVFASALRPLLGARSEPTTVLDLASGHGGFALALASLAKEHGWRLRIIASDLRAEYVAIGRRRAAEAGLDVEFRVVDALHLSASVAPGEVDVITCTQSLHHFGARGVVVLVAEALRHARRGILFVDLARAVSGLAAVGAVTGIFTNRTYFHDATVSVRNAFVPEELALLARCAPGGDRLSAFLLPPMFAALRSQP